MLHAATSPVGATLLGAATLLLIAGGCGAREWADHRQVGPFAISATFDLTAFEPVLRELPALEQELRRVLALGPCDEPISVLLLGDEREHRALLAERYPNVPYRRALFVRQDGQSTVYAYRHPELAIDLRHECTHALLHADLAMLPLWLDEGLAEYYEMPAEQRAFDNPHAKALRWNMRLGFVRRLEALEGKQDLESLSASDYQYAWAWTHFLLHGPKPATEQLWKYLGAIRRSEPPEPLSSLLERALPSASKRLVQHHRGWSRRRVARPGDGQQRGTERR